MTLNDVNNVSFIISEGYCDDGVFLHDLWMDICNSNHDFELSKTFETLILMLRFMIDNQIAELIGYDEKKRNVIRWGSKSEDELKNPENYLAQNTEKKLRKNLFPFSIQISRL